MNAVGTPANSISVPGSAFPGSGASRLRVTSGVFGSVIASTSSLGLTVIAVVRMNEIGIDLLACLWIQAALRLIERSGARELPESFGIPLRLFLGDNGRSQPVGNLSIVGVRLKHFRDLLLSRVVILLLQRNPPERRVREKFRILLGFFPVGVVGGCRFLIGGEKVVEIRDQTVRRLLAGG